MAAPFPTTGMRFRPGAHVIRHQTPVYSVTYGSNGSTKTYEESPRVVHNESQSIYDIVTPNFRKRSAAGEIFNNRMYSVKDFLNNPLANLESTSFNGVGKPPDKYSTSHNVLPPPLRISGDKSDTITDEAITQAYANVTANEGDTLLWIGELKESVAMFLQIGNGIQQLVKRTASQRKRWAKGKLTVEEAQQLTLQILYGILPLEQQVADFMAGLFKTKDMNGRHTARGMRVATDNASYKLESYIRVNGLAYDQRIVQFVSESQSTVVRAGVLYEYDVDTPWLSIILEPKAVISTAYALSRLSFVIDWFINVGDTLAAWSPSAGVNELSAWKTVTVETIQSTITHYVGEPGNPRQYEGESICNRVRTEKWREPISRADLVVLPRLDVNLDLQKVLAMVLLFAKVKKTI